MIISKISVDTSYAWLSVFHCYIDYNVDVELSLMIIYV